MHVRYTIHNPCLSETSQTRFLSTFSKPPPNSQSAPLKAACESSLARFPNPGCPLQETLVFFAPPAAKGCNQITQYMIKIT
jgi:hypothetical protein